MTWRLCAGYPMDSPDLTTVVVSCLQLFISTYTVRSRTLFVPTPPRFRTCSSVGLTSCLRPLYLRGAAERIKQNRSLLKTDSLFPARDIPAPHPPQLLFPTRFSAVSKNVLIDSDVVELDTHKVSLVAEQSHSIWSAIFERAEVQTWITEACVRVENATGPT